MGSFQGEMKYHLTLIKLFERVDFMETIIQYEINQVSKANI